MMATSGLRRRRGEGNVVVDIDDDVTGRGVGVEDHPGELRRQPAVGVGWCPDQPRPRVARWSAASPPPAGGAGSCTSVMARFGSRASAVTHAVRKCRRDGSQMTAAGTV
jgi:hypothetical protein